MLVVAVCCPELEHWILNNIGLSMASFGRSETPEKP